MALPPATPSKLGPAPNLGLSVPEDVSSNICSGVQLLVWVTLGVLTAPETP